MIISSHILFVICLLSTWISLIRAFSSESKSKPTPTPYHDWDYLMFSQRWPITACVEWEEKKPDNTCALPADKMQWIVHGIWPTKWGTEGPLYCPSAVHFDPNQLEPFLDQLQMHWTNVEVQTKPYSFWRHEWDKHGTCSINLPLLDSIPNFFLKGLELNEVHNLSEILSQGKIIPGTTGYTVEQIGEAVKAVTNHYPMIECVVDQHTKESMISEIRMCFDKNFEIIDCDQSNPLNNNETKIITNCSSKKLVMYSAALPSSSISYQMDYLDKLLQSSEDHRAILEIYKIVKFLIWFSI